MKFAIFIIGGLLVLGGVGAVVLSFTGGESDTQSKDTTVSEKTKNGPKAPSFVFKNYDGEEVSSESFLGKPYILNSWAVWCPFCVQELPDFGKLQEEFGDSITIVAINRAESLSRAKKYTDEQNTTGSMIFLLDPRDSFYKAIGGFSMPETLFVSAEGEILLHKRGFMRLSEMQGHVNNLFGL